MKQYSLKLVTLALVSTLLVTGCARNMASNVYTSDAPVGKVLEGTVISSRPVTIKNSDKLENNGLGMLGGGILGGVAGSGIGNGTGQGIATVGAAIAGAAIGSVVQDQLGKSNGMEYIVRLDAKYVKKGKDVHEASVTFKDANESVDNQIKQSIDVADTQTDLLSVVQGADTVFQPGQRVLIVYNNDRPRLVASQY